MKFLIRKLNRPLAIAAASALFGLSTVESQAASNAVMVFTVEGGVVTHINITAPFGFFSIVTDTYRDTGLILHDLYVGNTTQEIGESTEGAPGMINVAGNGVSYNGPMAFKWDMIGSPTAGDLAVVFGFPNNNRLSLTSGDFVEFSGGFAVDPDSGLSAPTAGIYSATFYQVSEGLGDPLTNTIMVEISVNAVPEPGSSLLGLLGAASLLGRRRR